MNRRSGPTPIYELYGATTYVSETYLVDRTKILLMIYTFDYPTTPPPAIGLSTLDYQAQPQPHPATQTNRAKHESRARTASRCDIIIHAYSTSN